MSIPISLDNKSSFDALELDKDTFSALVSRLGITVQPENVAAFRTLLWSTDLCAKTIMSMEDYTPKLDLEKYPRTKVAKEACQDEPWAARTSVRCACPSGRLLQGRTVVLKDNIALAGIAIHNGGVTDWTPQFDASVATRVLDQGATIVGKAVCEAACFSVVSDTASSGPVHNPHADGHSAGGSSSGCARLVAKGLADMALGTDQGGSIRIPASACGLVGLKPTWGLVPYSGIIGHAASIDHVGPMCRTTVDCAALLEAIAGSDGIDDRQNTSRPVVLLHTLLTSHLQREAEINLLRDVRIGVLEDGFNDPSQSPEVAACVRRAIDRFRDLGATTASISTPLHRDSALVWMCAFPLLAVTQGMELSGIGRKELALTDLWAITGGQVSQETFEAMGYGGQNTLLRGTFLKEKHGPALAGRCVNLLRKLNDEYDLLLRGVDVMVMPTTPSLPCKVFESSKEGSLLDRLARTSGVTINTAPFNSSGHPALSFPVGFVGRGDTQSPRLPVGMQVVGRKHEDLVCLKVAASWEKVNDWRLM